MSRTLLLRLVAVAIAAVALFDPALTRDAIQPRQIALIAMDDDSVPHAERLQRLLGSNYAATVRVTNPASPAAACPSDGACIVVSAGRVPERLTAGAEVLGGMHVPSPARAIRSVTSPLAAHPGATATLRVALSRPVPRVEVYDGDVVVGVMESGDLQDVVVPWVPLDTGARALRVAAGGDVVDVGVVVHAEPSSVLMHEPEPSWIGTFVRRALEDDRRFAVQGRVRVAPPVTITRGGAGGAAQLTAEALDETEVVVVTSPQMLRGAEVDLLERFVARRGGSLVLIPDSRPSGAVMRLLPRIASERREPQPRDAGPLRVSEWLTFEDGVGVNALATLGDDAVVVARALGRGLVIASGALDAWRYRDDERFDGFWRQVLWEAAELAGPPLQLTAIPTLSEAGAVVSVRAELQSLSAVPAEQRATGSVDCAGRREHVRLWPGARLGVFDGRVRPQGGGPCEIVVEVNGISQRLAIATRREVARAADAGEHLASVIRAHGGRVVEMGAEPDLIQHVQQALQPQTARVAWWPMRSVYWLLPFAGCLAAEWWLRRRSGLS